MSFLSGAKNGETVSIEYIVKPDTETRSGTIPINSVFLVLLCINKCLRNSSRDDIKVEHYF